MSQIVIFKRRRGSKGGGCHQRRHTSISVQLQHRCTDAGCRTMNMQSSSHESSRSPCDARPSGFEPHYIASLRP
ncbi:hypothetical protein P355_2106 [Burkholderia cenocepacia KC-01]|nr:hypothetical protein P355_2106 [Burkholderia cenocepacia KC-01]